MKKRRFSDKQRGKQTRKRKPIMFLSLEGNNKTEKLYLKAINEDYGEKFALKFTSGRETDPANMWQALQDMIDDSFSPSDGDKAFCICDRDFEGYKENLLIEIKQKSRKSEAKLIISNPVIEIWFLNHFKYSTRTYTSKRELIDDLCNYIPCYEKNADYYTSHLKAKTDDAIRNSIRQIDQANTRDSFDGSIPDNPGTEFFEVVQSIST